jgi:L-fucose mutarotase/ribose pyranase (RbsD/FucU family)
MFCKNFWKGVVKMAKKKFVRGMLVLAFGLLLAGCATYATRDAVITPLGLLTPSSVNVSRGEIVAEYTIILGLITSNYESFLEKTKGVDVDIIDVNYFNFYRRVQAVKRD